MSMKNQILLLSPLLALSLLLSVEASAWTLGDGAEYGGYWNHYGNDSNSVKLYSPDGKYMGNLNDNPLDPNSVSNPYGRYGSEYSLDSINNPYGRYRSAQPWW